MMRTEASAAMLFLMLLSIAAPAPGEDTGALTLDEATAMASQNNLALRNARLEVEKARDRLAATRTRRLPSLTIDTLGSELLTDLSFRFERGEFGTFPAVGPIPGEDTRVDVARTFNIVALARVTQLITQQHEIGLGIRLAETAVAVDREQERAVRQGVVVAVKRAYFGVLEAESAMAAAGESVALAQEVARTTDSRFAQGVVLEADRLDAQAHLASASAAALAASNALRAVSQQFNHLIGRDLDAPVHVAPLEISTEVVTNDADVTRRADVRASELRVEQARLDLQMKRADRIPEVSLVGAYLAPVNSDLLPSTIVSASLLVSYEPFTWGRRDAEIREKQSVVEQAQNAARDQRQMAAIEISVRAGRVAEAAANVEPRRLERTSARERLRVVKQRFDRQAARVDEILAASAQAVRAAAAEQEAVTAWWSACAEYEQAIGNE